MKTRDKRRDSGEYYPGGRVVARPGTAPQQVVVQWSDVQNKPQVAPLPERYKDSDVKTKINEIASKFATVAVAALIGWTALGGVTVHTARKDQIYNDDPIVTNVTYSAEAETDPTVADWAKKPNPAPVTDLTPATNYTDAAVAAATNGIRSVDGAARPLPKYLWLYNADDSYPDAAQEYYRSRGDGKVDGGCSSVRDGGFLYRNFDFPFDDRAEFVVRMSAGKDRFASVGVAQVGTNLTEQIVTSGKPEYSVRYKWLPGATVDGINENGVVAEINVVDGDPQTSGWHTGGDIHPLAAVRWALDRGESAAHVASNLAARVSFPALWTQNFHYMIADERETWIVENGSAHSVGGDVPGAPTAVMTNFKLYPNRDTTGAGQERYDLLAGGANITNAWYTRAYRPDTTPPWVSEFDGDWTALALATNYWARAPKEQHRGETFRSPTQNSNSNFSWWQTVHTSVYDLTNRTLRVAVQEVDDWYTFAVQVTGGGVSPEAVRRIVRPMISADNPSFAAAVLAVAVNTNSVEQIGELKQFFDKLPPGTVGTSLGGIVLALLGAVAWLKKRINRLSEFKSDVPTIGDIAKTLGWTGEDQN